MNRFIFVAALLVSFLAVSSTMALAQEEPVAIQKKHREAIARGDVDAALALYADDAVLDGFPACKILFNTPCVGKAAIRKALELRVKHKVKSTAIASYPSGNVLTSRNEVQTKGTRKAGIDRIIRWDIMEVNGGKIVSVRSLFEFSDPLTARYFKLRKEQRKARAR